MEKKYIIRINFEDNTCSFLKLDNWGSYVEHNTVDEITDATEFSSLQEAKDMIKEMIASGRQNIFDILEKFYIVRYKPVV